MSKTKVEGKSTMVNVNKEGAERALRIIFGARVVDNAVQNMIELLGIQNMNPSSFLYHQAMAQAYAFGKAAAVANEKFDIATQCQCAFDYHQQQAGDPVFKLLESVTENLFKNKEAKEEFSAIKASNMAFSAQPKDDEFTFEEPEPTPEKPKPLKAIGTDGNTVAKHEVAGPFETQEEAEAYISCRIKGLGAIQPLSAKSPLSCGIQGCLCTLDKPERVCIAYDPIRGKEGKPAWHIVCPDHGDAMQLLIGIFAEKEAGENKKVWTEKEKAEHLAKYKALVQSIDATNSTVAAAQQHYDMLAEKLAVASDAEGEVREAINKGIMKATNPAAQAIVQEAKQLKNAEEGVAATLSEAEAAKALAEEEMASFSAMIGDDLVAEFAASMEKPGDPAVLAKKLDDIKKKDTDDPYPNLGPDQKCGCGKGNSHYKNCCGKNVFYNKNTGQHSRGKSANLVRFADLPERFRK